MIKYGKTLTILAFAFGALGFGGGFLGAYHPAGDSLAVFRLYAMAALVFAMFGFALWRQKALTILSLAIVGYGVYSLRDQFITPDPAIGYTLLQHNNRFSNDARDLVDYAQSNLPDIITLQEITTGAIPQLAALRKDYPYQVICPFAAVGGVAILSRFRFANPPGQGCEEGSGMVSARVEMPFGDVTVVSLHLNWPWPYDQSRQLPQILAGMKALARPVLIGGDFNMVPWAEPVLRIGKASDARVIGGLRFTKSIVGGAVQLPIDHVISPLGWPASARRGPQLGSDHYSVIARFAPK